MSVTLDSMNTGTEVRSNRFNYNSEYTGPRFWAFSTWADDITRYFSTSSGTVVTPCAFLAFKIPETVSVKDIKDVLENYFENKLAWARKEYFANSGIDSGTLADIEKSFMPSWYLWDALKYAGVFKLNDKYRFNVPFVFEDITEQDYNGNFSDVLCTIPHGVRVKNVSNFSSLPTHMSRYQGTYVFNTSEVPAKVKFGLDSGWSAESEKRQMSKWYQSQEHSDSETRIERFYQFRENRFYDGDSEWDGFSRGDIVRVTVPDTFGSSVSFIKELRFSDSDISENVQELSAVVDGSLQTFSSRGEDDIVIKIPEHLNCSQICLFVVSDSFKYRSLTVTRAYLKDSEVPVILEEGSTDGYLGWPEPGSGVPRNLVGWRSESEVIYDRNSSSADKPNTGVYNCGMPGGFVDKNEGLFSTDFAGLQFTEMPDIKKFEFNCIIPFYQEYNADNQQVNLISDNNCLEFKKLKPLGIWFNKLDSAGRPAVITVDTGNTDKDYTSSWSLSISAQIKPYYASNSVPVRYTDRNDMHVTMSKFAESLSRISELSDTVRKLQNTVNIQAGNAVQSAGSIDMQIQDQISETARYVKKQISGFTDKVSALEEAANAVREDLAGLASDTEALQNRTGELESSFETASESAARTVLDLSETVNGIESRTSDLETDSESVNRTVSDLSDNIDNIESRTSDLETLTETAVKNISDLTDTVDNIESRTSDLETASEAYRSRIAVLENTVSELSETVENLVTRLAALESSEQ